LIRRKKIFMAKGQSELPGDNTEGISRLKSHLLGSGRLTEDQFLQAEDYALTRKISIQEAVLFLNLIDYTGLGQSLAKIYGKPYRSLLSDPPLDAAKAVVPLKFAERWTIFPVAYDPENNLLVLAVGDPTDQQLIEQVKSIFPPPFRLAFTVASAAKIEKAIEVHYKGKEYTPAPELKVPKDFTILADREGTKEALTLEEKAHTERKILLLEPDRARAAALKTILRGEGYLDVAWVLSPQETVKALKREPSDLLLVNGERSYIPLELGEGKIILVQKRSIVMVLLEANDVRKDLAYQRQIAAQVCFLSGENMEGAVYLDLPKSHSRLSDFLNYSKMFFFLEVGDKDYLVNSQFVKMVCPSPPE
jgi:CheY-like chemotaxis protein